MAAVVVFLGLLVLFLRSLRDAVMVLIPIVTVVLSAWLDAEPITIGLVLGGLLIIVGVYVGALRQQAV